jgi:hypothetical protein
MTWRVFTSECSCGGLVREFIFPLEGISYVRILAEQSGQHWTAKQAKVAVFFLDLMQFGVHHLITLQ